MRIRSAVFVSLLVFAASSCGTSDSSDGATSTTAAGSPSSSTAPSSTTSADETTTAEGGSAPSGDADAYATSLAIGLENAEGAEGDLKLSADEAECVAPTWVDTIGADTLSGQDVTPTDLEDPNFSFDELGLDLDQGYEMIDAFDGCDIDIYGEFLASIGSGLTPDQQSCLSEQLDQDLAREFLANSVVMSDLPPDLASQFDQISQTCQLDS